jgi:hypothetical protein
LAGFALNDMHKIKRVLRIDYYLELWFEDDSVRAISLMPYLNVDPATALNGEVNTSKVIIRPEAHSIIWDDGTEISADFLYENSLLLGWVDRRWGEHAQTWQPIKFSKAEIKVEVQDNKLHSYLLLDGKRYPELRISSASFGIHENIAWYHVPFPGDEGVYEPEWEEPPIVFDTLKQLVEVVNNALETRGDVTIDITEQLQRTGRALRVGSLSPRNAAIIANHFNKNAG